MASPATAAFKQAWRSANADRRPLFKLELLQPTTRTLYLARDLFVDPDGRIWEPFIMRADKIVARGAPRTAQIHPAHVRFKIANRKVGYQQSGTVKNLTKDFYLEGATLTIYLWESRVTVMPGYVNFATDRLQAFKGVVLRFEPEIDGVWLWAEQDIGPLLEQIPKKIVNRTDHSDSPEDGQDIPIPAAIGDLRAPFMGGVWGNTRNHDYDLAGGARGTVPGVLTDKGTGSAKARVVIAEHELADLTNAIPTPNDLQAVATRRARCGMFLGSSGAAHPMEDPSESTTNQCKINTPTAGAAADIADQALIAHAPIPMVAVRTTGAADVTTGVTNPDAAMDVLDPTTYARISNTGKLVLIPGKATASGGPVRKSPSYLSVTSGVADETLTSAGLFGGIGAGVEIGDDIIDGGSPQRILQGSVVASKTSSSSLEMDRDADDTASGTGSVVFASIPGEIIIGYGYSASATVVFRARWGAGMSAVPGQTIALSNEFSILKIKINDNVTVIVAATTNGTTTLAAFAGSTFVGVRVGDTISGTNIPAGTTITAIASLLSLTMSAAASGSGTNNTTFTDAAGNGWDPNAWNFDEKDLIIDVATAGTGTIDIYWVAIGVRYRPGQNLLAGARDHGWELAPASRAGPQGGAAFNKFSDPAGEGRGQKWRRVVTPAIYDLSGDFQFNTVGAADDGSGTYTGTANSLIEIASDAAYWLLVTYGLAAAGDIQTATGVFGSFKGGASDARALLTTEGLKIAAHLGRLTTVGRVIEQIARESGTWIYRSRFTNKFHCLVWKPSPPAQYYYDRKIRWNDILDGEMRTFRTPVTDVINAIRVKHSFDHNHNRYLGDVNLTKTMSSNGASNAFSRDTVREGAAVDSYAKFRRRETEMIQAEYLRTDAAALSLMRRTFDMSNTVLPGIAFQTTLCPDMERGRVIELDTDLDAHEPFPGVGSDGSWAAKKLWVTEVHQSLEGLCETQIVAVADVASITSSALIYDAIPFGGIAMPV